MGRIQSDIGLVTGLEIGNTIQALMALARSRDAIQTRTDALKRSRRPSRIVGPALGDPLHHGQPGQSRGLPEAEGHQQQRRRAAATVSGTATAGAYQFTPLRTAESAQFLSARVAGDTDPLGGGTFSFRFGDDVLRSASLDMLGGGTGFVPGKIRITDRSGASAEIDLSTARSIATCWRPSTATRPSTSRPRPLVTGSTSRTIPARSRADLKVQEVGRGTTAASLGLAESTWRQATADGQDMLRLTADTPLAELNDGSGVLTSTLLPDISYTLRDGTTGTIDFSPIPTGGGTRHARKDARRNPPADQRRQPGQAQSRNLLRRDPVDSHRQDQPRPRAAPSNFLALWFRGTHGSWLGRRRRRRRDHRAPAHGRTPDGAAVEPERRQGARATLAPCN